MKTLTKTLLVSAMLVVGFAPAQAAKLKRAEAVELCSARVMEELGKGDIKVLRAKHTRGAYKVRILKMQENSREKHAYVDCNVEKDGTVSAFETDIRI